MSHATELVWAAGFFDGEGCTCVGWRRRRWMKVVVAVGQNEPTTLERFRQAVGNVGQLHQTKRGTWQWRVDGSDAALAVIDKLWPYLSGPKREQALKVMDRYIEYLGTLTRGKGQPKPVWTDERRAAKSVERIEYWRNRKAAEEAG